MVFPNFGLEEESELSCIDKISAHLVLVYLEVQAGDEEFDRRKVFRVLRLRGGILGLHWCKIRVSFG